MEQNTSSTAYGHLLTDSEIEMVNKAFALYAKADAMSGPQCDIWAKEALMKEASNSVSIATRRAYYESFKSADQPHVKAP
jgi:hypothetical protein